MKKWNTVTESIDEITGEVLLYSKPKSEDFVIVFNSASQIIATDCTPTETKLLFALFKIVEYNTNRLHITSKRRVDLREAIGGNKILNNSSFSTAFKGLITKKIILEIDTNKILSPYFFWKGELHTRVKLLKTVLNEQLKK